LRPHRIFALSPNPPAAMFSVLIPARYASARLPGKPLADIAGKQSAPSGPAPRASSWRPMTNGSAPLSKRTV
jgi:hypothetical protein